MNKINTPTSQPNDDKTELTSDFTKTPAFGDFQNKFDVLVHTIPDGLILLKDEQIKYSNKNFADMLGYSINEITELGLREVIAPNDLERVLERSKKRLRGETVPTQYEIELIHKDNKTIIPVSVSVGVIGSGTEKFQFVIVRDISDKIEIENKFVRELQLQQYFMDYLPDSIYFKDIDSRFIKANKATLTKMGLSSFDELLGKTDFDIFCDEHAQLAKKDEEEIIKSRTSIINKIEKEIWRDGKVTWASTTKIPLIDENDFVYGTFGITRDITELKKAEDIKDALFKISTAVTSLNNINVLYEFIHKSISELMSAENLYIALYHQETDTVSFPYFVDQVDEPPVERKAGRGLTEYILRSGKAHLINAELDLKLREAGETSLIGEPTQIWLGVPLNVEGKTIGAIVVQDYSDSTTYSDEEKEILIYVSEQIALAIDKKRNEEKIIQYSEELKETNAAKDKFFSIIAHDLKSPFHGLLGLTRMIVEEYDSMSESEVKSYLQIIKESTESTYKLIENLLEWSRLESGKMKYNPALQNMFMIVEDTRILLNQNARMKNINLRNKLGHQSFVWGDDTMLQSLVQNLISNAIKFTPTNGIIEVTENQFDSYIEYTVSDTGIGIKESDIEKLFRIDMSFSTKGTQQEKGTGLGLVLCKEIVNIHGGEISVQSKVSEGTKIIFTLSKPKY
ncbi:MAG: PAS domain S-box protein [Ignavibacteriales bacterium]|nr:MAG: PAS domain S-box protein [Ignavibacteriales bacterium]